MPSDPIDLLTGLDAVIFAEAHDLTVDESDGVPKIRISDAGPSLHLPLFRARDMSPAARQAIQSERNRLAALRHRRLSASWEVAHWDAILHSVAASYEDCLLDDTEAHQLYQAARDRLARANLQLETEWPVDEDDSRPSPSASDDEPE